MVGPLDPVSGHVPISEPLTLARCAHWPRKGEGLALWKNRETVTLGYRISQRAV